MTTVNIGELLSVCIDLAEHAGAVIKQVHNSGDLQVTVKGYTESGVMDALTQADTKAQVILVDGLLSRWPSLKIVAEEDRVAPQPRTSIPRPDCVDLNLVPEPLRRVPIEDIIVFIDPLDATLEFTKGHVECVMTLIGITVQGLPKAGVMYQPFVKTGVTLYGMVGAGVWGRGEKEAHEGVVVATTASHTSAAVEDALQSIKGDKVMRVGGAGYKATVLIISTAMLVLEGIADVYVFPKEGCKLWDTCAPHALLLAAGGNMTDSTGAEIIYGTDVDLHVRKGVLATMRDHEKYAKLINNKK